MSMEHSILRQNSLYGSPKRGLANVPVNVTVNMIPRKVGADAVAGLPPCDCFTDSHDFSSHVRAWNEILRSGWRQFPQEIRRNDGQTLARDRCQ